VVGEPLLGNDGHAFLLEVALAREFCAGALIINHLINELKLQWTNYLFLDS
jgi:hypothetical protein